MLCQKRAELFKTFDDDPVRLRGVRLEHFEIVREHDKIGHASFGSIQNRVAHFAAAAGTHLGRAFAPEAVREYGDRIDADAIDHERRDEFVFRAQVRPADWVAAVQAAVEENAVLLQGSEGVAIGRKTAGAEGADRAASSIFQQLLGKRDQANLLVEVVIRQMLPLAADVFQDRWRDLVCPLRVDMELDLMPCIAKRNR